MLGQLLLVAHPAPTLRWPLDSWVRGVVEDLHLGDVQAVGGQYVELDQGHQNQHGEHRRNVDTCHTKQTSAEMEPSLLSPHQEMSASYWQSLVTTRSSPIRRNMTATKMTWYHSTSELGTS